MPQCGFESLRCFEVSDDALVLRRYMADWKFANLIETKSLYLAPASQFQDQFEGHYTHFDNEQSIRKLTRLGFDSRAQDIAADARNSVAKNNQKAVVISCWARGCEESPRMWQEYGGAPEAVALETTVGHLRRAFGTSFLIVPVTYLDFSRQAISKEHSLKPFFFKERNDFDWEREIRVVGEMEAGRRIGSPRLVPIDLAIVFQKVILSPTSPKEYRISVESRLREAELSIPVSDSTLK